MEIISLAVSVLYTVAVLGTCGYLLSRGFTQSFILWFAAGTIFQAVQRFGFYVVQHAAPGGLGANMRLMPAFYALGMLGALCYIAGFIALAAYLLRTKPAEA